MLYHLANQIADEEVKLHLEDYDSMQEQLEQLFNGCIGDFPDDDKSEIGAYAAQIAWAHITDQTRQGHARCVVFLHSKFLEFHSSSLSKSI